MLEPRFEHAARPVKREHAAATLALYDVLIGQLCFLIDGAINVKVRMGSRHGASIALGDGVAQGAVSDSKLCLHHGAGRVKVRAEWTAR